MIRPFTLICMLLACASGLYLYQTKHRVQLLDRDIAQTVQATSAARDRSGALRTEWTLLNDLERLRVLADQHMQLRPVAPSQFTTLADLGNRLPAPRAPEPEPGPALMSQESVRPEIAPADDETELADLPTPPVPPAAPVPMLAQAQPPASSASRPAQVASAQPNAAQAASLAATKAAQARAAEARLAALESRAAERRQMAEAPPRPQQAMLSQPIRSVSAVAAPAYNPPAYTAPQTSSLGMAARTMMAPPVPVSAMQYSSPN
jgi:hypothetical protein